jgi:hypothetical protein
MEKDRQNARRALAGEQPNRLRMKTQS